MGVISAIIQVYTTELSGVLLNKSYVKSFFVIIVLRHGFLNRGHMFSSGNPTYRGWFHVRLSKKRVVIFTALLFLAGLELLAHTEWLPEENESR